MVVLRLAYRHLFGVQHLAGFNHRAKKSATTDTTFVNCRFFRASAEGVS